MSYQFNLFFTLEQFRFIYNLNAQNYTEQMKRFMCILLLSMKAFTSPLLSDDSLFNFIYQKDRLELKQQQHRLTFISAAAVGGSFFMSAPDNRNGYLMGGLLGLAALYVDRQVSLISNAHDQYSADKLNDPKASPKPFLVGIQENYRALRYKIGLGLVISALMSFKNESYDQQISRQLVTLGIASGMVVFEFPVERMIREQYQKKNMRVQLIQEFNATKINVAMMI